MLCRRGPPDPLIRNGRILATPTRIIQLVFQQVFVVVVRYPARTVCRIKLRDGKTLNIFDFLVSLSTGSAVSVGRIRSHNINYVYHKGNRNPELLIMNLIKR